MKVLIAGSRDIMDPCVVGNAIHDSGFAVTAVISGMARGVDRLGKVWALFRDIPVIEMPADWKKHGKSAGFIRNAEMVALADAAVIVWDGKSRGTADCLARVKARGIPYHLVMATW